MEPQNAIFDFSVKDLPRDPRALDGTGVGTTAHRQLFHAAIEPDAVAGLILMLHHNTGRKLKP